jgi:hypothetical protein
LPVADKDVIESKDITSHQVIGFRLEGHVPAIRRGGGIIAGIVSFGAG